MTTKVELADDLARDARRYAARRGLMLQAVVEEGIRSVLGGEGGEHDSFVLQDESVDGSGLQAEFRDEVSSRLRGAACEGRGG